MVLAGDVILTRDVRARGSVLDVERSCRVPLPGSVPALASVTPLHHS